MSQYIFLVEDDDSLRQSMEALLRFSGYTVFSYATPEAFLQADVQVAPAIVISDMRMPGMSGVDLHKTLLERGRTIPPHAVGQGDVAHPPERGASPISDRLFQRLVGT